MEFSEGGIFKGGIFIALFFTLLGNAANFAEKSVLTYKLQKSTKCQTIVVPSPEYTERDKKKVQIPTVSRFNSASLLKSLVIRVFFNGATKQNA